MPEASSPHRLYFHTDGKEVFGPFPDTVIADFVAAGSIKSSTLICEEGTDTWIKASESALSGLFPRKPPLPASLDQAESPESGGGLHSASKALAEKGVQIQQVAVEISRKVIGDIAELRVPLLLPFVELRSLEWLRNKTVIGMMVVGLFPMLTLVFLGNDDRAAYWALAFYFSAIWGLYFFGEFAPKNATRGSSLMCFFGTGLVSIPILLSLYHIPPFGFLFGLTGSSEAIVRLVGMLLSVAIPEEICKALVLFLLIRTAKVQLHPNTMLFYGLISGLGFGIYEGVDYQMGRNFSYADSVADYYILNLLRLTSLPFIHAVWTGIAGYFLALSAMYPARKHGLVVLAILIPSLLHALHNTFHGVPAVFVDAVSVVMLLVYMAKSEEFESVLKAAGKVSSSDRLSADK